MEGSANGYKIGLGFGDCTTVSLGFTNSVVIDSILHQSFEVMLSQSQMKELL